MVNSEFPGFQPQPWASWCATFMVPVKLPAPSPPSPTAETFLGSGGDSTLCHQRAVQDKLSSQASMGKPWGLLVASFY